MKVKQKKISEQMHLAAVVDCEDRVITLGAFETASDADTAAGVLSALLRITGFDKRERIEGVRRYAFAPLFESMREMEKCGVGSPVEEII